jgi:hypothetical protein
MQNSHASVRKTWLTKKVYVASTHQVNLLNNLRKLINWKKYLKIMIHIEKWEICKWLVIQSKSKFKCIDQGHLEQTKEVKCLAKSNFLANL